MAGDMAWDREVDVVVVGSGAAGLSAALSASVGGAEVLILEKSDRVGGTTAMSGGGTWVPGNHHMLAAGCEDSIEDALAYIRAVMPPGWEEDEGPLWRTYLEEAPAMLAFVEHHSPLRFTLIRYPDLKPDAKGSRDFGRLLSPALLSRNLLGPWRDRVRKSIRPQLFTYDEMILGPLLKRPVRTIIRMAPTLLHRILTRRVGMGASLVVGLLKGCLDRGCAIETLTPAAELVIEGGERGRVVGVAATLGGERRMIRARKGVVLATGGFEWDPAMLSEHFPTDWILLGSPRTNTGDGHRMAARAGAVFAHMGEGTIYPVSATTYEGQRSAFPNTQFDRAHCILVDRTGRRFACEGQRNAVTAAISARDPATGRSLHAPAWRIFDAQFAAKNPFALRLTRWVPGQLHTAATVEALARLIDVDPAGLRATVERFNRFAENGVDEDFHRGESAIERHAEDAAGSDTRNPSLGTIAKPPFHATPYYLGLLGTKGGPRTNARAQALRADGTVIAGLYCAGSIMANFFGTAAVASGSTLGPFMTWGYIAGQNLLRENQPG
ncbi:MAG: FAD-dependent oxidoreductase [Alphaproteobacteria bacterium]